MEKKLAGETQSRSVEEMTRETEKRGKREMEKKLAGETQSRSVNFGSTR